MARPAWWTVAAVLGAAVLAWAGYVVSTSPIALRQWLVHPSASWLLAHGANPHPVRLALPPRQPLSAVARLGGKLFVDSALSGSGKLSCASCHNPAHAYAPANNLSVQLGGGAMRTAGVRAVPSLEYLYRQQNFSIGPDNAENEAVSLQQLAASGNKAARTTKTVQSTAQAAQNLVPQGGLFWDGRANTLQQQAGGPLFNPMEMDAGSVSAVAARLQHAPYARDFTQLFGPSIFQDPTLLVSEALFAISRYQIEDPRFHPFTSKFDAWVQGKARFTPAELGGYLAFNDPKRGNCAACHLDQPTSDGLPPLFTDTQYEALGVPRNPSIPANHDPHHFDLGLCGPYRSDLKAQTAYCGMFLTPTLRNVATRHAFFHNGIYHSLQQVLTFYNFRSAAPQKIYPHGPTGTILVDDDLPPAYRANVDHTDPPFDRKPGERPPMSTQDMRDIIAFLQTLTDGYAAHP